LPCIMFVTNQLCEIMTYIGLGRLALNHFIRNEIKMTYKEKNI